MLRTLLSILGIYKVYEWWLWKQIEHGGMPEHIGIILDGNRRWAGLRNLNPSIGHHYGAEKIEELLDWCLDLGIRTLTLYVFSTENFQRPLDEVEEIMKLAVSNLRKALADKRIHKNKVRVKAIGQTYRLPQDVRELIGEVEEATKDYDEFYLNIAIAYGGRAEIVDAAKQIALQVKNGFLDPQHVNENVFEKYLYTSYLPKSDPDLVIRSSGEERLSGFLLWQSAYSELCFTDVFWPEFRKIDLWRAIRIFQKRERRFGK